MLLKLSWPAYTNNQLPSVEPYCVPNLQLYILIIDLNGAGTEFDSDGQIVLLPEALVSELEEEAGLANTYRLFSVIKAENVSGKVKRR